MKNILLFDAYGTLFKINIENKKLDSILGDKKDVFLSTWRNKILEYSWLTSLMEHWEDFNSLTIKALKNNCKIYNFEFEKLKPILMKIYETPSLFPEVKKSLKLMADQGYKCSIISNGVAKTLSDAVEKNKIESQIDQIFSASTVEKYKVSPKVYRMATAHYNTGPSKMYFVSSNSWDISGAQSFGYKTIWVNREKLNFDSIIDGPDYEVANMAEILKIIA